MVDLVGFNALPVKRTGSFGPKESVEVIKGRGNCITTECALVSEFGSRLR